MDGGTGGVLFFKTGGMPLTPPTPSFVREQNLTFAELCPTSAHTITPTTNNMADTTTTPAPNIRTTAQWRTRIKAALKRAGTYNQSLDFQIESLAGAMRTLELATAEIDTLTTTIVWEETRYGRKMAPHPVFKIQRDAQSSVTRQMKQLQLTTESLTTDQSSDPLIDLTQKLINTK